MCGGGYNCLTTGISPWEKTVLKFTKMEEKAMNTKKITALALAALMAAGSTATAFAANGDELTFVGSGKTLYGVDDGVIVKDGDNKFNPGDTIYVRLEDKAGAEDKDIDRMKVYADWKVGGSNVESIDIVYKKGNFPHSMEETTFTFTVDGVKFEINGKGLDTDIAVKNAISKKISDYQQGHSEFLKDEIATEMSKYEAKTYYSSQDRNWHATAKEALELAGWKYNDGKYENNAGQKFTEEEAVEAEPTITHVVDGYVNDGDVISADYAKELAVATVVAAAAADADLDHSVSYKDNYTYWVEIKTKDSDTTKELDVAGTLYLGTSKYKAEDSNNKVGVDFVLSNRVADYSEPDIVEDEYTFNADKNGAVKFSDDAEEVTLYFGENEDAWFTFNAKGQSALNFGYTLKFNSEIADLFPKANIDFISWIAEPAANRTGDLYITAEEDTFLYQVTEDGKGIKEVKGADYDENEGAWHIRTRKLGSYVISDMELDTTAKVEDKDEASSNSSTSSKPNGDKHNPDTGR